MKRPVGNTCFDSGFFQLQGRCRVLAAMSFSTDIFPYIYNLLWFVFHCCFQRTATVRKCFFNIKRQGVAPKEDFQENCSS